MQHRNRLCTRICEAAVCPMAVLFESASVRVHFCVAFQTRDMFACDWFPRVSQVEYNFESPYLEGSRVEQLQNLLQSLSSDPETGERQACSILQRFSLAIASP